MKKLLNSNVTIITGGSRGIGRDIARNFSKNGSNIIIIYNKDIKSAKSIKNKIISDGNKCEIIKLNLEKRIDYEKIFKKIKKKYGRIDILVNNAGYLNQMNYLNISKKEWHKTININLSSIFFTTQAISKIFKSQKSGNIINISSVGAQIGGTRAPHYAAAKLGVISLTKSFSKLLAPYNVRVNGIAPGIIKTKMINQFAKKLGKKMYKDIPLKKIGTVDDISDTALFLSSKLSKYITGQIINVNGGSYLG